jgi:hypothetical protein
MKLHAFSVSLLLNVTALAQTIPGMMPVDVYKNLEEKGFAVTKNFGSEQNDFVCKLEENGCSYTATVYTQAGSVSKVKVVTVMGLNLSAEEVATDKMLKEFFGYMATLPYEGNDPTAARSWVESNLGQNAERNFGPVQFQLFANAPRARVLRMSCAVAKTSGPSIAGWTMAEVISKHGPATATDKQTGWAHWAQFKARFEDGVVKEAIPK